jgi:hypothetical protein
MKNFSPKHIGIFLGVLYGIIIRILWELEQLNGIGGLVTFSFMFIVPFVIGFIRIYFEYKVHDKLSAREMTVIAWQPIFVFLLVSVVTLLEGSICVLIALPAFMLCSSLGGLTAGYGLKYFNNKQGTLSCVALLPFLIAPVEVNLFKSSKIYTIENIVIIDASPSNVWKQLGNVNQIGKDELSFSFTQLMGIPSPISANMSGAEVGSIRTSVWEKGVKFDEVITEWKVNEKMSYRFDIDPDVIPDTSLDKHVKLGGAYFSPLTGFYKIKYLTDGKSELTLSTTVQDNTNFGVYSRIWGEFIFRDFHTSLLKLMKTRSELTHRSSIGAKERFI